MVAHKVGQAKINVTSEEGKKVATCEVKVIDIFNPNDIKFAKDKFIFYVNTETPVGNILLPKELDLEGTNIILSSDNPKVITIEDKKIKTHLLGSANISIKKDDNIISVVEVSVIKKPEEKLKINVKGYNLNFSEEKKDYILKIKNEKKLDFDINKPSKYVIINGNENLKNGSIITITINDTNKKEYTINIKKKNNYTLYFIIVISILLLVNIIRMIIKSKKNK